MKVILAVMCTTWAVVEIRPEKKIQARTGFESMTSFAVIESMTSFAVFFCSALPTELTSQLGAGYDVGSK